MKSPSTNPTPSGQWANVALIVMFFGLIWLPTLDTFFHLDRSAPPGENRLPASLPKMSAFSFPGAQTYLAGLELYFNDHFGFRNSLVRSFQKEKIGLFHDRSVYKVFIGQDHFLFWGESQMVEHYLGLEKFSPEQLAAWQRLLEKRRDWLAQRGIQYYFVVPPDKQDIYPEELPLWLIQATPPDRETKLDQFLKYMKTHSTVPVLDLRSPLIEAKKIQPTYLQNDTHWNVFGAFIAGKTLLDALGVSSPLGLNNFIHTNAAGSNFDMAHMLGINPPEQNYYFFKPDPAWPQLVRHEDKNYLSARGYRDLVTLDNPLSHSTTVILFVDSYGAYWDKFFGYSFKTATFFQDNGAFDTNLIVQSQSKIVVTEMLERFFNTEDPQRVTAREGLP